MDHILKNNYYIGQKVYFVDYNTFEVMGREITGIIRRRYELRYIVDESDVLFESDIFLSEREAEAFSNEKFKNQLKREAKKLKETLKLTEKHLKELESGK